MNHCHGGAGKFEAKFSNPTQKQTGLQRMPGSHLFCDLGFLRVEMGDRQVLLGMWWSLDLDKGASALPPYSPPSFSSRSSATTTPACFRCGRQWTRISQEVPEAQPQFLLSLGMQAPALSGRERLSQAQIRLGTHGPEPYGELPIRLDTHGPEHMPERISDRMPK